LLINKQAPKVHDESQGEAKCFQTFLLGSCMYRCQDTEETVAVHKQLRRTKHPQTLLSFKYVCAQHIVS